VNLGRGIIFLGLILVGAGAVIAALEKYNFFRLGRLPGDIVYRSKNVTFYFPLVTCVLLSLLLTLLFSFFRRR
jgi:hypothetical protein